MVQNFTKQALKHAWHTQIPSEELPIATVYSRSSQALANVSGIDKVEEINKFALGQLCTSVDPVPTFLATALWRVAFSALLISFGRGSCSKPENVPARATWWVFQLSRVAEHGVDSLHRNRQCQQTIH